MKTTGVLETCLYVDDLDAAEDFYQRVLGLQPFAKVDGRHVFFRCGNGVFLLFNPQSTEQPGGGIPPHGARGPGHVAFRMPPETIDDWRRHLHREGIPIELEYTWPNGGFSLYFRDPAGNSLELATPTMWGLT